MCVEVTRHNPKSAQELTKGRKKWYHTVEEHFEYFLRSQVISLEMHSPGTRPSLLTTDGGIVTKRIIILALLFITQASVGSAYS